MLLEISEATAAAVGCGWQVCCDAVATDGCRISFSSVSWWTVQGHDHGHRLELTCPKKQTRLPYWNYPTAGMTKLGKQLGFMSRNNHNEVRKRKIFASWKMWFGGALDWRGTPTHRQTFTQPYKQYIVKYRPMRTCCCYCVKVMDGCSGSEFDTQPGGHLVSMPCTACRYIVLTRLPNSVTATPETKCTKARDVLALNYPRVSTPDGLQFCGLFDLRMCPHCRKGVGHSTGIS